MNITTLSLVLASCLPILPNVLTGQEISKTVLELDVVKLAITFFQNDENKCFSLINIENISNNEIGIDTNYISTILEEDVLVINIGGIDLSYHNPISYNAIGKSERYELTTKYPDNINFVRINLILESDLLSLRSQLFEKRISYEIDFWENNSYKLIFDSHSFFKTKSFKNYRVLKIPIDQNIEESIEIRLNGAIYNGQY